VTEVTAAKNRQSLWEEVNRRREAVQAEGLEEEKIKLVVFSLGQDRYAFPGKDVKEILRCGKITYVPGSPPIIHGIINIRGDIESVINIHQLLGLPDPEITPRSRIIIGSGAGIRSGILVDAIEDVTDFPVNSIHSFLESPPTLNPELVIGVTTYDHNTVTVLGVDNILGKLAARTIQPIS
jgi:purine-binding chemotaxis protein CheW